MSVRCQHQSELNEALQRSWPREPLSHTTQGSRQYHSCAAADQSCSLKLCAGSAASAGKESHIPEEGRKPEWGGGGGGLLRPRRRFPAGPRSHPQAPPLARTPARVLSSYYTRGKCLMYCFEVSKPSRNWYTNIKMIMHVRKSNSESNATKGQLVETQLWLNSVTKRLIVSWIYNLCTQPVPFSHQI